MNDQQGGVLARLAELERVAHEQAQQIEDRRTKVRLRAELWAHVYAAEFAGLRTAVVRNQAGAVVLLTDSEARLAATWVANAAGKDFDTYCQMVDLK